MNVTQGYINLFLGALLLLLINRKSLFRHSDFDPAYKYLSSNKRFITIMSWLCISTGAITLAIYYTAEH